MTKKSNQFLSSRLLILLVSVVVCVSAAIYTQIWTVFSPKPDIDISALEGEFDTSQTYAVFNNEKFPLPSNLLATLDEKLINTQLVESGNLSGTDKSILGETIGKLGTTMGSETGQVAEKVIKIDLTGQRLFMYGGDELIDFFSVSTGKWGRTPTGEFRIWSKFRYTKMSGGSRALRTYYYLPNVPYVMFFYNSSVAKARGFSIHGTYWHDNFGTPMSHGCINMKTEDAKKVYEWAGPNVPEESNSIWAGRDNPGTKVVIYGKTKRW